MESLGFNTTIRLENDVVLLRPLTNGDVDNLLTFSLNEPQLWTYSLINAAGKENLTQYIALALEAKKKKQAYPFIVFDKKSNSYAGTTRLYDINMHHKTASLGYTWYGKDHQGTGLNKACKYLILSYAFEKLGLERIEFRCDANNSKSIAAMKSIGCTEEGLLRNNCASPTGRRDSKVLSILREEWFANVKKNLAARLHKKE